MVVGETETEPLAGCVPVTPLIETDAVSVVVQLKVLDCPAVIVDGLAVKETTLGGAGLTVIVVAAVAVPPGPVAVSV